MSERFYVEPDGASYVVRDREIVYTAGMGRGRPRGVIWKTDRAQAEQIAAEMNATRGHATDEPRCANCGAQPAGPAGAERPLCGSCHSRLADMHG